MITIFDKEGDVRQAVIDSRQSGHTVGLVPTMGGLHDGHLSLVRAACQAHEFVIVSIYVNPTQFSESEDWDRYPRQLDIDKKLLESCGDNIALFVPDTLYRPHHATMIAPQGVALPFEGVHRPHFFTGVATVVFRLFQAVPADIAYFGEKDFQQLAVIKQMVNDFDLPITISSVPTMRADDGLALSSRNHYLDLSARYQAAMIYKAMTSCAEQIRDGHDITTSCEAAQNMLQEAGFSQIDYFSWCDPDTFEIVSQIQGDSRLLVAAWLDGTRLIDNECYEKLCGAQK
ncbi:MAG: pantoate--beta-alanine ligase [Candidatus Puniceispirillaceae bacterium]